MANTIPAQTPRPPPVVAIFNSMDDIIEALRLALERAGLRPVSAKLSEIQSGVLDLVAFVQEHRPSIIVCDIPRPYEVNWNVLKLLRDTGSLKQLGWVLTTTDKPALESAVGAAQVVEVVIGKPYTVDVVVSAVRALLSPGARPAMGEVTHADGC
jgi:CheY-like chemotaxis protein